MTTTTEVKPWDFSHVLDFVNSFSARPELSSKQLPGYDHYAPAFPRSKTRDNDPKELKEESGLQSLGDFSKLWQYLGTPEPSPSPAPTVQAVQPRKTRGAHELGIRTPTNYTSDGAFDATSSSKRVPASKHRKQTPPVHDFSSAEDQTADTLSDGSITGTPSLTKSQRKKRNRRERRAKEAAAVTERVAQTSISESEVKNDTRKLPAKKASVHAMSTPPPPKYNLRLRDSDGKAVCSSEPRALPETIKLAVQNVEAAKKNRLILSTPKSQSNQAASELRPHAVDTSRLAYDAFQSRADQLKSFMQPASGLATPFVPASVQPTPAQPPSAPKTQPAATKQTQSPPNNIIQPLIMRSNEDRNWALFLKLLGDFREDAKYIVAPMNLTTHNNDPKGIHVFVDASNIFIGFKDQLKRARNISWYVQIPEVDLSFDALALLMERRRPVAKRVLAGSTPHLPAFDKAKAVGYETMIMEKVYKARELTERQIFFKEQDRARRHHSKHAKAPPANNVATLNGNGAGSGSGSGSETNAPQYAPARMIEQGVDEMLHLKICESVIDTDIPSTIVLATGDAAQAEYSEGFMAMAERALKKGWNVELVSWSMNISNMYRRREWVEAWGDRFRIIYLDDYAEELLDM